MRKPQGSAHLRRVFCQPYASAAKPYVTACCLAVGLTRVTKVFKSASQAPDIRHSKNIGLLNIYT